MRPGPATLPTLASISAHVAEPAAGRQPAGRIHMPMWTQAAFWGGVAGSALLVGAALGYEAHIPRRVIAAVMAFGAGVLISALAFDLMDEAFRSGGFDATSV